MRAASLMPFCGKPSAPSASTPDDTSTAQGRVRRIASPTFPALRPPDSTNGTGNVGEAIRRARPWAVDVSSGVEALGADGRPQKGIKDAARIAAFVAEVRHADARPS